MMLKLAVALLALSAASSVHCSAVRELEIVNQATAARRFLREQADSLLDALIGAGWEATNTRVDNLLHQAPESLLSAYGPSPYGPSPYGPSPYGPSPYGPSPYSPPVPMYGAPPSTAQAPSRRRLIEYMELTDEMLE